MGWTPATARTRSLRIAAALAASLAAASAAPPVPSPAPLVGSVSGTVRIQAGAEARKPMLSPYARPRYRPPARELSRSSPETVVVYLRPSRAAAAGPRAPGRVSQRDRTIIPHVSAVQTGSRVDFPNEDDVFHNLFSLSGPKRFNLGRYPPGESRSEVFDRAGVVRLFCDIHSEMSGIIVVVDTPYFTHPDADGRYRIDGVADGEYTAIVWHEAAGADSARVVVTSGGDARVDFALGG